MKTAILLVNLGTPNALTLPSVRIFLKSFLMDPYVIDRPYWLRALLVNGIIVPFRARKSLEAYRKIWTPKGSPIMVNMQELTHALKQKLGKDVMVAMAMRYGEPYIDHVMKRFKDQNVTKVYAIPLYPQFADSSSQTAIDQIEAAAKHHQLKTVIEPAFYAREEFLHAQTELLLADYRQYHPEYILFSYHGLPVEHILKRSPNCKSCVNETGCHEQQRNQCYRAQCFYTARTIMENLKLKGEIAPETQYGVAFQSRLGRLPWIKPYADESIEAIANSGVKRLQVVCPSFTSDCLETLEEIGMANKERFLALGGTDYHLTPSLNAHPVWVDGLAKWCQQQL